MSDMSQDVKIKRLIRKYGVEGYGLYNYILELVVRKLATDSPMPDLEESSTDIAQDLKMDTVKVEEIMLFCIHEGLFEQSQTSGRILATKIYKFLQQSETRSKEMRAMIAAYTKGGCLRLSETVTENCEEENRIEENRTEEKRVAKSKADATHPLGVPINSTTYQSLLTDYGKVTTDSYIERVIDYCASRGKSYRDYAATARQWMRKDESEGKLQRRVKIERPPRVFGDLPDSSE